MGSQDQITDSPVGWVAKHVRRYVESDGRRGHRWHGVDTLLIATRGRRTGVLRRTALIYGRDGDRYIVVASNGGRDHHPNWYLNLRHTPTVEVQVGAERLQAYTRPATEQERPGLWAHMTSIWPEYNVYRRKTDREIPVVVIERTGATRSTGGSTRT